jgi:3-oxoadipate enol-lactonase
MKTADAFASDGTKLRYTLRGEGPLRLALSHSLAMTGEFWDPVAAALGDDISVLTWDCRGHGDSGKPSGPYRAELFADDLAAVFDHAGWDTAVCGGASMGGTVTLAFAARHPARVAALGLIDTTAWYGPEAPRAWAERAEKAKAEGLASLTAFQETRWFSDDFRSANRELVDRCAKIFCRNEVGAFAETCAMLGLADVRDALPGFRVPTTIIVGEEDYATPLAMAEGLHEAISGSTLEIIPKARHLTPLERPDVIADRLIQLLRKVGG